MTLISKTYWAGMPFNFARVPDGARLESLLLRADDFRQFNALYWQPGNRPDPTIAVVCMHPRADFTRHYSFPALLDAGIACLGANTRSPNNDIDTVHEDIALDVAACVKYLKHKRGIEHVVLFGNSGGGSLGALFQAQAELPASDRIETTPAGEPARLRTAELIPADGLVLAACHRGQGNVMTECIDPSVTDETDPHSTDPALNMYEPANGFAEPPAWCEYSDEFAARYRAAQLDRVRRLDRRAHDLARDDQADHVMVVYRTMANLHYVDRHLDPSDREYGSLLSDRPDLMNFKLVGFGRVCTPRAWLSTWSGVSSNADLCKNLAGISVPTFVANAGRDREIYPSTDHAPIVDAVAAEDTTVMTFSAARHYFEPDFGHTERPQQDELMAAVVPWILERFAR